LGAVEVEPAARERFVRVELCRFGLLRAVAAGELDVVSVEAELKAEIGGRGGPEEAEEVVTAVGGGGGGCLDERHRRGGPEDDAGRRARGPTADRVAIG